MPLSVFWLIAAVLLAPLAAFPPETGIGLMQAKTVLFIVFGLAVVVWRVPNPWIQGLVAWTVLAFLASGMRTWALTGVLAVLAWSLLYAEATRLTEASWRKVRLAVAAAAVFQLAWMGLQAAGVDPIFVGAPSYPSSAVRGGPPAVVGWFSNPMDTSLFLGVSLPVLAAVSPWLLVLAALGIVALGATVGAVALAIVALWWAPSWPWRATVAAGLLILGVWFVAVRDPGGMGLRPVVWTQAVVLAAQRPLLGWGPNALGYRIHLIHPATNERWNFLFNDWLQAALELGVAAPALAVGWLGSTLWRLRGRWAQTGEALPALLVLLAASTFSIPLRIGPTALLAALYLGRLEAIANETA